MTYCDCCEREIENDEPKHYNALGDLVCDECYWELVGEVTA